MQNISNLTKHAWIVWLDADFLALVGCIEFIVVAQTAAVDELLALLCFVIVEISVGSSVTSAN